ncbi:outer membrane beta-barrel protein [Dysgonomonas sp. Marseille-P4677]|uniref:outer membrane beta-barrel protein n=1 Tax=Dysgonomonas sp. Marseille-P4677 TaxID=2364790 RepID=UPI0019142EB5|nr:outer membrane beta-barrel protein [Dysgonomonas sp. Marseille-P4677]MBK5719738.1 outer membrane beta-barrel protein [Dysgonomonas sp. Marseille-P4677]
MKKRVIIILLSSILIANIWAQEGRHEMRVGYGVATSNGFINALNDMQITDATRNLMSGDKTFKGAFQFGYKYSATDKINLGISLSYEWAKANSFRDMDMLGKLNSDYYTIAAEADYVYFRREKFTFYSTLGLGATIYDQTSKIDGMNDSSSKTNFNFQITPAGVKYGDHFGFFGEIGFGYKGLFNFGLFSSF